MSAPARIAAAVVGAALAVVLAEGVHSLATGRSLLSLATPGSGRLAMLDEERIALAARLEGAFVPALDPHVGFRVKSRLDRDMLDARVTTDDHGQRTRLGPPPEPGAPRVVVLGDSVAFGFGVADDETFAHRLEELLAAASAKRPVVHTVASPGWNTRNAVRYLSAHLERYAPDVVVYLPVANDLHDSFSVDAGGHLWKTHDPLYGARPAVAPLAYFALMPLAESRFSIAYRAELRAAGLDAIQHAVTSGITPESRRRWEAFADDVRGLARRLEARGAHLTVQLMFDRWFEIQVERALPELAVDMWFRDHGASDILEGDMHPNPRMIAAGAHRIAHALLERGWIAGDAARLPPLDEAYAARVVDAAGRPQRIARLEAEEAVWRRFVTARVDLADGVGFHQIYGGVQRDATVGRGFTCGLAKPAGARTCELTIERLDASSWVYPLELRLTFGDAAEATVGVPPPDADLELTLRVPLPATLGDAPFVDVGVWPSAWVHDVLDGTGRLAAFRLVRLALL